VVLALRALSSANRCSKLSSSRPVSVPIGRCGLGAAAGLGEAQRAIMNSAPPPLRSTAPGSQVQGPALMCSRSNTAMPNKPKPAIAEIIPNLRMLQT
jgi:hypothetical protein